MDLILHPTKNLVGVVKPAVNAAQLESDFLLYHTIPIMLEVTKVSGGDLTCILLESFSSMLQKYLVETCGNMHYYLGAEITDCGDDQAERVFIWIT